MSVVSTPLGQPGATTPVLTLHDLTGTEAATKLLNIKRTAKHDPKEVLETVRRLDPTTASKLQLKEFRTEAVPFKLMSMTRTWNNEGNPSYVAVSYCWHSDEWNIAENLQLHQEAGWSFPISSVMLDAVLDMTEDDYEGVWIDQVCIDQTNLNEKAHAIGNMDLIYRCARRVIILLEDVELSEDEEQALRCLTGLPDSSADEEFHITGNDVERNVGSQSKPTLLKLVQAVRKIISARWFTRAWCAQEYQLAPTRIFVVACRKASYVALGSNFFLNFRFELDKIDPVLCDCLQDLDSSPFESYTYGIRTFSNTEVENAVFETFYNVCMLKSALLCDKISIALNISGLGLDFQGDINLEHECKWILASIALASGDISVLGGLKSSDDWQLAGPQIPWFQWPLNDGHFTHYVTRTRGHMKRPDSIHSISPATIDLDILLIRGYFLSPTANSSHLASLFMGKLPSLMEEASLSRSLLACALDCGASWMVNASSLLGPLFQDYGHFMTTGIIEEFGDLWPTFVEILEQAKFNMSAITMIKDNKQSVINLLCMILKPFHFIQPSNHTALIFRMGDGSSLAIVCIADEDFEAIHVTFSTQVAMPLIMNGDTGLALRRLWFLTQNIWTDGGWNLRAKAYLIGNLRTDSNSGECHVLKNCKISYLNEI